MAKKRTANKLEQKELVRTIGRRFMEARKMNNLTQKEAASFLGYTNSSKLAKIENATHAGPIPLWVILMAAERYKVSIDYLFGRTEEWEVGVNIANERKVTRYIDSTFTEQISQLALIHIKLGEKLDKLFFIVHYITTATLNFRKRFLRYVELNPKFIDSPGGSLITRSLDDIEDTTHNIKVEYQRIDNQINGKALKLLEYDKKNTSIFDINIGSHQ